MRATTAEPLPEGQVNFRGIVTTRESLRLAGIMDDSGNLTEKGRALSGEAPAARESAQPSRPTVRQGHSQIEGFSFVSLKQGTTLADVPEADLTAMVKQLRSPRMIGVEDKAAAERDAQALEAELARRQGTEVDNFDGDDEDTQDDRDAEKPNPATPSAELAQNVEPLVESGDFDAAVDAAEPVIGELAKSAAYRSALDQFLGGANPTSEMISGIAKDLGITAAEAGDRVNVAMAGFQAEAAKSVADILTPAQAESFVEFLIEHKQDVFNRAAAAHVKGGSLTGWQVAARDFAQRIRGIDPEEFAGKHANGAMVYQEDGRWWFTGPRGHTVDLLAAIAAGKVRPA